MDFHLYTCIFLLSPPNVASQSSGLFTVESLSLLSAQPVSVLRDCGLNEIVKYMCVFDSRSPEKPLKFNYLHLKSGTTMLVEFGNNTLGLA